MADGRIINHVPYDILYVVPNFIDTFHIKRCGVEDKPVNTKELMARVTVAEKVRAFNKAAEDLFNGYTALFKNVYPRVSGAEEGAWASVTVTEAAKHLNVQHRDRNLVLHAVYSHLMKQSQLFVMDNHDFLSTQTFYVRPRAQVERFKQVLHLMHTSSPSVEQFAMRAKSIIAELRKTTTNPKNQAPSFHPAAELAFTEDDQLFIRFLHDSLVNIRSAQSDPYTPLVCGIIKALGLYDGDVNSAQVRLFLVEMGVLAPWQDVATLIEVQPCLMASGPPAGAKWVAKAGATATSLGLDDLYAVDPLESIRHDFGQLPVYTIDDHGAQELDDGLSVEQDASDPSCLWVHVHVADPTAILPPTHSFARRARDMVYTHYFHHSSQSMLPESLVRDKLSLGRSALNGEAENVMTFSAKVDSTGNIVDYKVRAGIVHNVRVLKYDNVDAAMSWHSQDAIYPFGRPKKPDSAPLNLPPADVENLQLLDVFSMRMVANRLSLPSFSYGLGTPELIVSPKPLPIGAADSIKPGLFCGHPNISYGVREGFNSGSRQIVAEAAQVANRVASIFGRDHGIPLARRSLAAPIGYDAALADLLKLRDKNGWVNFFEVKRRAIQPSAGQYTLEPAEHWSLGVAEGEGYTRATSPLRRYGDLVTHWQIKHALLHKEPLFSAKKMQSTFEYIGGKEKRWKWVEQSHNKWWALAFVKRWMESNQKVRAHNPLEGLTGRATAPARQDIFRGLWVQDVHITKLGLLGVLEGTAEQDIGAEVAVSIDKIELATHPVLRLKPQHSGAK